MAALFDCLAATTPRPVAGELRVRVFATDLKSGVRAGPSIHSACDLGVPLFTGLAGIVEEIGDGVDGFGVGDEVYGLKRGCPPDGTGDVAIVDAGQMARKPACLAFADAAAVPLAASSAWQMLFRIGRLDRGETVLILGAESPTGVVAVQLAALNGVRVVAMSMLANEAALRALGASRVIDAECGRLEAQSRIASVIVDTSGGAPYRRAHGALPADGLLVSCVEHPKSTRLKRCVFATPRMTTACLAQLAALIDSGALRTGLSTLQPWT